MKKRAVPGGLRKQVRRAVRRASDVPSDVPSDVVKTGKTYVSINKIKKYLHSFHHHSTSYLFLQRLTGRLTGRLTHV